MRNVFDNDASGAIFIVSIALILEMILLGILESRKLPIDRATEFCEPHGIELAMKRADGGIEVTCMNGDRYVVMRLQK